MIQLLIRLFRAIVGLFRRRPSVSPVPSHDKVIADRAKARGKETRSRIEGVKAEPDAEALAKLKGRNDRAESLIRKGQGRQ